MVMYEVRQDKSGRRYVAILKKDGTEWEDCNFSSYRPIKKTKLWATTGKGLIFMEAPETVKIPGDSERGILSVKKETGRTILFPFPRRWKKEKNGQEFLSVFVEGEKERRWVSRCAIVWASVHGFVPKGHVVTRKRSDRRKGGYGIDNLVCGPAAVMVRQSQPRLPMGGYGIAKSSKAKPKDWEFPAERAAS